MSNPSIPAHDATQVVPEQQDTPMPEADASPLPQPIQPQPPVAPTIAPAPQVVRNSTPVRTTNGTATAVTPAPAPMPSKAAPHGAPARRYLNEKVTGVLLEGMKRLAAEQPEDPLRVLGEYLIQRSKDMEGGHVAL
ncbi:COMPASS (complex proteins associated with Set1p) component [Ptychographa xylographoides]|nr:COMPASS (complex proteins associated with Set1p) component [Ptychographa xylographoides]